MMKILINGLTTTYGGIESLFYDILRLIDKSSFQIDFLCFEEYAANAHEFEQLGARILYITRPGESYSLYKKNLQDVFRNKYDVYHLNLTRYKPCYDVYLAHKNGCKIVVHSHATAINKTNNWIYMVLRYIEFILIKPYVLKRSDVLLACSESAAKYLYGTKDSQILYNGINLQEYSFSKESREIVRTEFKIPDDYVLIGNIGRLCYEKNQKLLIDIMDLLQVQNDNYVVMIVGDGEKREELVSYVRSKSLEGKVIFTGYRNDISHILSAFDVFVLTSVKEAFPLALLEAQVNGLPCVVSENITKEIDISEIDRISESSDAADWAKRIVHANSMGRQFRDFDLDGNFDIHCYVKRIEEIYGGLACE